MKAARGCVGPSTIAISTTESDRRARRRPAGGCGRRLGRDDQKPRASAACSRARAPPASGQRRKLPERGEADGDQRRGSPSPRGRASARARRDRRPWRDPAASRGRSPTGSRGARSSRSARSGRRDRSRSPNAGGEQRAPAGPRAAHTGRARRAQEWQRRARATTPSPRSRPKSSSGGSPKPRLGEQCPPGIEAERPPAERRQKAESRQPASARDPQRSARRRPRRRRAALGRWRVAVNARSACAILLKSASSRRDAVRAALGRVRRWSAATGSSAGRRRPFAAPARACQIQHVVGAEGSISCACACASGSSRKLATTIAPALVRRIIGNGDEARVADRAAGERGDARARRQPARLDGSRRFGGIERHREIDFAVVHQLALGGAVRGKLFAMPPERRAEGIVPGPERRGLRREVGVGRRLSEFFAVRGEIDQGLFEKARAHESPWDRDG